MKLFLRSTLSVYLAVCGLTTNAANFTADLVNNPTQINLINVAIFTGSTIGAGSGVYTRLFAV